MGLYEELASIDVIDVLADKLSNGAMQIDPYTGKAVMQRITITPKPWVLSGIDFYRQCSVWKSFVFDNYRIIHPGCRACWKICYRPPTLEKLFATLRLQQSMKEQLIPGTEHKYHSKCGIERRPYVGNQGGYGAFWYSPLNHGLDIARQVYNKVQFRILKEVDQDATVILKRGCTEFELTYPPSDGWDKIAKEQKWDEKIDLIMAIAPDYVKPDVEDYSLSMVHAQKLWIEHAEQYGDTTYLKYCDNPIRPSLLNYQGSIHNEKDFETHDEPCTMHTDEPVGPQAESRSDDLDDRVIIIED